MAVDLLDRLVVSEGELTVERLLLEYWRSRLEERGDAVAHNVDDFHKLLREHARAWLAQPRRVFDRDDWSGYSAVVKRLGLETALKDLHDIEEGRFLTGAGTHEVYSFRVEALPFALALLVTEEITREAGRGVPVEEALDRILAPVRGFDQLADIVAAAAGLACIQDATPPEVSSTLIQAWLGLQNVSDENFEAMAAYIPARPDAFLDVAELPTDALVPEPRSQSLSGLLLHMRDHPALDAALERRVPRWLNGLSRRARLLHPDEDQVRRQRERDGGIDNALSGMTAADAERFGALTTQTLSPPEMVLDRLTAQLMAARPQGRYAVGLVGWGAAYAVAGDYPNGTDELAWAVRLNAIDWEEVRRGVTAQVDALGTIESSTMRDGAAKVLRLLGDPVSAAQADALSPPIAEPVWRRADQYSDADPHDPGADAGPKLDQARGAARQIDPATAWRHMGATREERDLEYATPPLARFDPTLLIESLRSFVRTAPDRTGLSLRQLGWRLPWLSHYSRRRNSRR